MRRVRADVHVMVFLLCQPRDLPGKHNNLRYHSQRKRVREAKSKMRLYKIKQTDLIRRRQIPEHPHIRHIVNDLL